MGDALAEERSGAERAIRVMPTLSVIVLAIIAAILSYKHMHLLVRRYGATSWTAALLPISVDGMIAASSMSLLLDSRYGRPSGFLPWTLHLIGSAASLAVNVAVAGPPVVGRLIAGWPSRALIGSYELLMRQIRHTSTRETEANSGRSSAAQGISLVRGEHDFSVSLQRMSQGNPRVRGEHLALYRELTGAARDHPRVRGEHNVTTEVARLLAGPSRVRGLHPSTRTVTPSSGEPSPRAWGWSLLPRSFRLLHLVLPRACGDGPQEGLKGVNTRRRGCDLTWDQLVEGVAGVGHPRRSWRCA
jgi:hypothetical protein